MLEKLKGILRIGKVIIYHLFSLLIAVFSSLFCRIRNKRKLIIYTSPNSIDEYLFFEFCKRHNFECKLIKPLCFRDLLSNLIFIIKSGTIFSTHTQEIPFRGYGQKMILIWHGIPIKQINKEGLNRLYKLKKAELVKGVFFLSPSSYFDKVLRHNLPKNVKIIRGYFRSLLSNYERWERSTEYFSYLPTWRRDCREVSTVSSLCNEMNCSNVKIYVKFHPITLIRCKFPSQIGACKLTDSWKAIYDRSIKITDYSSAICDWLMFGNREFILYACDLDTFREKEGLIIDINKIYNELIIKDRKKLLNIIRSKEKLKDYLKRRKEKDKRLASMIGIEIGGSKKIAKITEKELLKVILND